MAPPSIIMIRSAEPCAAYLPNPLMASANILGHMMLHAKPPLRKANNAISPLVINPMIMANMPKPEKNNKVLAGFSFPANMVKTKAATQKAYL